MKGGFPGSVARQYKFRVLNLIQSASCCLKECKEQFRVDEVETSYSFLDWLEGQEGGGWSERARLLLLSVKN